MVMEKLDYEILVPVIGFTLEIYQICMYFGTIKKFSIDVERPYFTSFLQKRKQSWSTHGKIRNGHGQIVCQVCGNPEYITMVVKASFDPHMIEKGSKKYKWIFDLIISDTHYSKR